MDDKIYTCPLCSNEFFGANCHSSCPMSHGCRMVKCPRCNYEFVEDSAVVDIFRGLFRKLRKEAKAS
ncbi:MAG: hypothetical protein WBX15_12800 [Thermoanaerobaculia bacterium]